MTLDRKKRNLGGVESRGDNRGGEKIKNVGIGKF